MSKKELKDTYIEHEKKGYCGTIIGGIIIGLIILMIIAVL